MSGRCDGIDFEQRWLALFRVTQMGCFLRPVSLDEIPQLINVLKYDYRRSAGDGGLVAGHGATDIHGISRKGTEVHRNDSVLP